ncbi:MAG: Hsp33 family molecular chaperone HslO [Alphaproteobacteria bacterium]|nr:Hsp33 family molecular chaperone HslO [Alphaproteobacteria bacterium]
MSEIIEKRNGDTAPPENRPDDNVIQPFQLDSSSLRGRVIRLGGVLEEILGAHDYPEPVAHLVAETVTLALLLSSMLKYEGIFTLQTKGDGPVSMLVADVTSSGAVRGCASFDTERLAHASQQLSALEPVESAQNHLAQYLGKGYIAFTVDREGAAERYQGIVELRGASLIDCVQHYFTQSEQIGTGIKMAVGRRAGKWRAGGIMLQNVPEDDGYGDKVMGNTHEDDWRRSMILMGSCTEDEFLDADIHSNALLVRLFHEEGVRVFEPCFVHKSCRCNQGKVDNIIAMMGHDELIEAAEDGRISMRCEFCSQEYNFDLDTIFKERAKSGTSADTSA